MKTYRQYDPTDDQSRWRNNEYVPVTLNQYSDHRGTISSQLGSREDGSDANLVLEKVHDSRKVGRSEDS